MKLGVCYYPEHWSEERWQTDAEQMHTAGISIVRIAEFAWAKIEKAEGKFDWDWLDRAIEQLATAGHQILLSTPTAAPPAWLITANPDILPVDEQGHHRRFGSRRHYCPNNTAYRAHSERITRALAERYGKHPAVIGWQIDNEFGCYFTRCYCETCTNAFQEWLQKKYTSLDELNQRWGTVFWSQTYNTWGQIEAPNLTVAEPNPSHALDYYRFASDSWVDYQKIQIETLRKFIPQNQTITHNIIASQTTIDYHELSKELDFLSWDSYPTGYAEMGGDDLYAADEEKPAYAHDLGDPLITGFFHSLTRGLKKTPFWIMEQQTGAINWSDYNTGVRPGALRLWTWQAAASGAEAVVYFRWRASRFGLEQHHAGLRKHDGDADTGYNDLLSMKDEQNALDEFSALPLQSDVGILLDYDDLWAMDMQPHRKGFAYLKHLFVYYRACKALGIEPTLISPQADLSQYKILLAPNLFLGNESLAARLKTCAEEGGTVLLGVRAGFKNDDNLVHGMPLPGALRNLIGAEVLHWHALPPDIRYTFKSSLPKMGNAATVWAEALQPDTETQTLAHYTDFPFAGNAAITEKRHAKGRALYIGIYPEFEQAKSILRYIFAQNNLSTQDIPAGLTAIKRGKTWLVMNFTEETRLFATKAGNLTISARDFILG